jgi:ABC-type Na+ efflux pump permease subunit/membrane protease YdiL (CAAX protease family)
MRLADVALVFRKEIIDLIRDRRSVLAILVFPVVIHPVLLFGSARLAEYGKSRLRAETITVVVEGGLPELRERILGAQRVRPLRARDPEDAVRSGRAEIGISLPASLHSDSLGAPEAVLYYDASSDHSRAAKDRVAAVVEEWRSEVRRARLDSLGAGRLADLLPVRESNAASEERMAGGKLGRLVPFLIVFLLLNGASFAAVDLFAGERERKTIETLLTSLVDRSSIVLGKFLAVVVSAVTAGLLFLGSSLAFSNFGWIGDPGLRQTWSVPPASAAVVLLLSLPLAFLVSAVLVLISSHARSYKEAQTLLLPTLLLAVVPAAASVAPGIRLESVVAIIPIANVAVAVREALIGNFPVFPLALVAASNALAAYAVLARARAYLSGERSILGGARPEAGSAPTERPRVREAMILYAVELLVLYYVGSLVQTKSLLPGLILTLWGFLLVPTILFALRFRLRFDEDLSLRRTSPARVLGGVVLAPGVLLAANLVFRVQSRFLPVPEDLMEAFEKIVEAGGGGLPWILFAVAVSPGICEELFFRGLLLGQHRRVLSPARAVLLGALLFGFFHLSVYRLLPTALVGAVAGWLVIHTGSIFPAMALHASYNALAVLASGRDGEWTRLVEGSGEGGLLALVSLAVGVWLVRRGEGSARGFPGPL